MLLCLLEGSVSEFLLDGLEFGLGCLEEFLGSADLALDVLNGSINAGDICGSPGDTGDNVGQPSLGILGFDCGLGLDGISKYTFSLGLIRFHVLQTRLVVAKLLDLAGKLGVKGVQNDSGLVGFHLVPVELFLLGGSFEVLSLFLHVVEFGFVLVVCLLKCFHLLPFVISECTLIFLLSVAIVLGFLCYVFLVEGIIFLLLLCLRLSSFLLSSIRKE